MTRSRHALAMSRPLGTALATLLVASLAVACGGERRAPPDGEIAASGADSTRVPDIDDAPLTVFAAGSLARPLRAALDSFRVRRGVPYTLETAGSLELARRLTELGKRADVVALADEEVFPRLLMPSHVAWYARFARNRLVLAHAANAPGAEEAERGDWRAVLQRPTVEVGRADPDLDPAGYRTLMLFQLAERHYEDAGLAARLERHAPRRNVRPKSAELVALLQANELDYAWMYESSARGARLPFVTLPREIDLGDERSAAAYDAATVRVLGARAGDTIELRGVPIRYGIAIPRQAPHPRRAGEFLQYLLSPDGARVLRAEYLDAMDRAMVVGDSLPPSLEALRAATGTAPRSASSTAGTEGVARDSARR